MRRFTRLTNGFSKSADAHRDMMCLYAVFHNFIRDHKTLRCTPAESAGLVKSAMTIADIVALIDAQAEPAKKRGTYKPRQPKIGQAGVNLKMRHYHALRVLASEQDWVWLTQVYKTLRARVRPVRDKRQRLRPVHDLVSLGCRLMDQVDITDAWSPRRRAVEYRDGLMICLLAYRPLRLKNFAAMRLGTHLVEARGHYGIIFPASEMKNRVPYEAVIPEALEDRLRHYLQHHRPVLLHGEQGNLTPDIDAVWVSEIGTHLEAGALATRIRRRTEASFGKSIPPHWFRDAAATTIAVEDPVHARDSPLVLGHAGLATTEKHYNQARSLQASRRHQAMLAGLMQNNRKLSPSQGE